MKVRFCFIHDLLLIFQLEEYTTALNERDQIINGLENSLKECINERDIIAAETVKLEGSYSHQIETLQMQLEEAKKFISNQNWVNINPRDHLQLKNKVSLSLY